MWNNSLVMNWHNNPVINWTDLSLMIEFNGMHRSWKWTQIALLKEFLDAQWVENLVLRGAYYRKWLWNSLSDPFSVWRQENWNKDGLIPIRSNKLKRELRYILFKWFKNHLSQKGYAKRGVILLDRWWLWRCMDDATQWVKTSIFDALKIEWTNNLLKSEVPISDLYVVLQPSKEELLKRLTNKEENLTEADREYKKNTIMNQYNWLYQWFLDNEIHIKDHVVHLSSDDDPLSIHNQIVQELKTRNILATI